jgi:hypothetical protein
MLGPRRRAGCVLCAVCCVARCLGGGGNTEPGSLGQRHPCGLCARVWGSGVCRELLRRPGGTGSHWQTQRPGWDAEGGAPLGQRADKGLPGVSPTHDHGSIIPARRIIHRRVPCLGRQGQTRRDTLSGRMLLASRRGGHQEVSENDPILRSRYLPSLPDRDEQEGSGKIEEAGHPSMQPWSHIAESQTVNDGCHHYHGRHCPRPVVRNLGSCRRSWSCRAQKSRETREPGFAGQPNLQPIRCVGSVGVVAANKRKRCSVKWGAVLGCRPRSLHRGAPLDATAVAFQVNKLVPHPIPSPPEAAAWSRKLQSKERRKEKGLQEDHSFRQVKFQNPARKSELDSDVGSTLPTAGNASAVRFVGAGQGCTAPRHERTTQAPRHAQTWCTSWNPLTGCSGEGQLQPLSPSIRLLLLTFLNKSAQCLAWGSITFSLPTCEHRPAIQGLGTATQPKLPREWMYLIKRPYRTPC